MKLNKQEKFWVINGVIIYLLILLLYVIRPESPWFGYTLLIGLVLFGIAQSIVAIAERKKEKIADKAEERLESLGPKSDDQDIFSYASAKLGKKSGLIMLLVFFAFIAFMLFVLIRGESVDILGGYVLAAFVLFFGIFAMMTYERQSRTEQEMWGETAQRYGLQYAAETAAVREPSLLFQNTNDPVESHVLIGTVDGLPFRCFQYYAYRNAKEQKNSAFIYSAMVFTFSGNFPHIFLDRIGLGYDEASGVKVKLPNELAEKFTLYAPKEYEQEALEIFSPDALAKVADLDVPCDIEFIGHDMMIFFPQSALPKERFAAQLALARQTVAAFASNLTRMHYAQIGTYRPTLSREE